MPDTLSEDRGGDRIAPSAPPAPDTPDSDAQRERRAFWAFVIYLAAALPVLLWIGSYRWFFGDEWSFFADRSTQLDDLFRPQNQQHWVTIPVLVYRGLYSTVGLHAYWPYQLFVIGLHLTVAALLRVIMRRAQVGPWISTVAAASFVLLGPAEDNILWAFQITFVGALAAGLTQVILADHDGPVDRRDWIGVAVGLVGLMMSGQAPSLIVGAGLVCVLRRRWAAAVLHTVPLGVIYVVWARLADVTAVLEIEGHPFTLMDYVKWMRSAASGLFMALGFFAPFAVLLALVLIGGTVLAWRSEGSAVFLRRAAAPVALVAVCILTMSVAAPSRFAGGPDAARAGRFLGVMAALTLPAIAVAIDALGRRWHRVTPFVLLLLIVPVPFNIIAFGDDPILTPQYYVGQRANIATLPAHPLASRVPPWVQPNNTLLGQPEMTIGWLLEAQRDGALPPPSQLTPIAERLVPIRLGVATTDDDAPEGLDCQTSATPVALDPRVGDRFVFETPVSVAGRSGDTASTPAALFDPGVVEIVLPDLHLLLTPGLGENEFRLCR